VAPERDRALYPPSSRRGRRCGSELLPPDRQQNRRLRAPAESFRTAPPPRPPAALKPTAARSVRDSPGSASRAGDPRRILIDSVPMARGGSMWPNVQDRGCNVSGERLRGPTIDRSTSSTFGGWHVRALRAELLETRSRSMPSHKRNGDKLRSRPSQPPALSSAKALIAAKIDLLFGDHLPAEAD